MARQKFPVSYVSVWLKDWSRTADADASAHPSEQQPGLHCDGVDVDVDVDGTRTKKEWFRYEATSWG